MKKILLILTGFFIFWGCMATKNKTQVPSNVSISGCPSGGECTIDYHKNSSLEILTDGTGQLYPRITPGENVVVKFRYAKPTDPKLPDLSYEETLHFILPEISSKLENNELTEIKMLYGKHVFERGEAGFRPVRIGTFSRSKNNKIELSITIKEVKSHKIKQLSWELPATY